MKVLIADDSKPNQALLSDVVKRSGHEVLIANNGEEAVNIAAHQKPDLILMDIIMPIEDGLSATVRIRKLELDYWLPIILISALDQPENIIKGIESGADDYLTRPIHPQIIQAKIRAMGRIKELQAGYTQAVQLKEQHLANLQQTNHQHNQLRRAMDEAAIVVETDTNGYISYCNDKFCELSGFSSKELLGNTHQVMHSGVQSKNFFKDLWETISQGKVWEGEICNKAKNGHLFWLRSTIIPFINYDTGKPHSYKAILFDITERKSLEAKLAVERERAEVTMASIAEGIITTDECGNVTFLNKVAQDMTGWPIEEAVGQTVDKIFKLSNADIPNSEHTLISRLIGDGNPVFFAANTLLISRKNKEFNIEGSTAPVYENQYLSGFMIVFQDATDKKILRTEVEWQAWHDALTSLPNRTLLKDRFNIAIANANRTDKMVAVCVLDLDDFKAINDDFNHEVGDRILVEVARRLNDVIRDDDTAARLGGDEFVLLLNGLNSQSEIDAVVQRVFEILSAPIHIDALTFNISSSIGIASYPNDNVDADTLLRHADQAMFQAKQLGRKRFTYFDQDREQLSQNRILAINRIQQAIDQKEMVLFYQPKVNMRTGKVIGLEALVRWQHPEQGLLGPLEFLPHIDGTDVDISLGNWVMEQALCQLEDWCKLEKKWSISVNIAGHHFTQEGFISTLKGALNRHPKVPPQQLELEILETTALDDIQRASSLICECQALGVKFSLDDFGTGYSSLSYLKQLPANWLKIDQSFVRDMLDDHSDMALVEGIISLSQVFQRQVIAEGVETAEHGVLLMRLGCQYAQGYGIAKPMPKEDVLDWAEAYQPDEAWSIWANSQWELSDLPLLVAQHDHIKWIQDILNAFDSEVIKLTENELTNHADCRLGRWYYGHGKKHYGHLDSFKELEDNHIKVYQLGHQIIELLKVGKTPSARKLADELLALKDQILNLLYELQKQVNLSMAGDETVG